MQIVLHKIIHTCIFFDTVKILRLEGIIFHYFLSTNFFRISSLEVNILASRTCTYIWKYLTVRTKRNLAFYLIYPPYLIPYHSMHVQPLIRIQLLEPVCHALLTINKTSQLYNLFTCSCSGFRCSAGGCEIF